MPLLEEVPGNAHFLKGLLVAHPARIWPLVCFGDIGGVVPLEVVPRQHVGAVVLGSEPDRAAAVPGSLHLDPVVAQAGVTGNDDTTRLVPDRRTLVAVRELRANHVKVPLRQARVDAQVDGVGRMLEPAMAPRFAWR